MITTLLAGLGIGSALTALIQYALKIKEAAYQSQRQALEARYKVIILLMYAAYDFAGSETAMRINRPDLKSRESVLDELRAEWINMLLFASESTLQSLREFILDPNINNLVKCAATMRLDLQRKSIDQNSLKLTHLSHTQH